MIHWGQCSAFIPSGKFYIWNNQPVTQSGLGKSNEK